MKRCFFILGAILVALSVRAGQYFQDFTGESIGSVAFADNSSVEGIQFGTVTPAAGVQDATFKELQLIADGAPLTYTAFLPPDLDFGAAVYAFSARWNSQIYRTTTNFGEGFSFNFGHFDGLFPGSQNYLQESGYPTGICFSVQTSPTNNPGFYIRVNGATLASVPYNSLTQWGMGNSQRHLFEVDWHIVNGLTVRLDGQTIFTNVATSGFTPQGGDRFVWGARTGDSTSEQIRLDNIFIATGGNLVQVPMGAPFYKSGEFPPNQTADKAFDGVIATKWLTFTNNGNVGATSTGGPTDVWAYSLTSAEDVSGRDPAIWSFQGSTNAGTSWAPCGNGGGFFLNRNETRTWSATNTGSFNAYRLNISTNRGSAQIQLSEMRLYRFVPVPSLTILRGAGSSVLVRWPEAPGYHLEYSTNLFTGPWLSNTFSVYQNGRGFYTPQPADSTATFYRLRKP